MANPIEFDAGAREDFDDAFNWYAERSPGAAIGFASEIDAAIEKIIADPERFAKTYAGCRYCSLKRYPFSVVYYSMPSETPWAPRDRRDCDCSCQKASRILALSPIGKGAAMPRYETVEIRATAVVSLEVSTLLFSLGRA